MLKGYASFSSSNKSPEWNGVEDEEPDDLDKAIIEESKKMKAKDSKQQKMVRSPKINGLQDSFPGLQR